MKARYVVRVTPADVGRRVSLRARLADPPPGGPTTTDTLGMLRSWADGVLVVERRDGTRVKVREDDLVAGRVVPPPPPRPPTRETP